ncbi:hypothetical protein BHM03_00020475 [Ensete ventricosum]|uniref:Copper transport protein n=1 Tax=Ensete ventricosum TaxID=4639 RepID=A0A426Z2C3_ENSVE|nr:hypothetical protein B296_00012087 [Ensete ventricosum]RZR92191.1 hypothetical protein BHM03_00020475 [Ensete ventricosum]
MDHGGMSDMGMNASSMAEMHYTHMTFFWGKNSEILFTGWPGTRGGMYALALVVVFAFSFLLEWLNHCRLVRPGAGRIAAGFTQTAMHALRVGLAYLVMLAVMSFNGGVLIVAVAGHALGFLLFGSAACQKTLLQPAGGGKGDLPPMACC